MTFSYSQEPEIRKQKMLPHFPSGLKETAKITPLNGYTDITAPVESEHKDASPTFEIKLLVNLNNFLPSLTATSIGNSGDKAKWRTS